MLPLATPDTAVSHAPWLQHPALTALQLSLRITTDCWALLAAPDGSSRKEHYLPKGEREPDNAYRKRLDAARPSGFFRDALRTYAGMLSRGSWISLPASLSSVLTDVDGRGTDLGVFLAAADLLVLRDGAALVLVLPPEHSWPSEGDRQEALRRGDRLSLPRLQLVPRANCLNWELPVSYGLPGRIIWREPVNRPISGEPAGPEGAVAEQINALLGDADAPDRWHYRSLQLLTTGDPTKGGTARGGAVTGLQLAHHPVCADLQATSGWRCDDPVVTTFEGIHRLPACWYTSDGSAFGEGDLPHLGLAHQYLNHFRCKSEYEELLSRTALPVGVRKGMVDAMGNSQAGPVVLGPNTCMDLPSDASFEFVEIRARSLAEHRAWLQILDDTMRRDALIPSQNRGAARTEMEISLTASQSYALLQAMAIQKASLFSTLLQHWCALTGETLTPGAGLQVTVSPLTPPIQPQPQVKEWIELFDKGVISREELRHQLALATANAISSPTLDDSPATRAGEGSQAPDPRAPEGSAPVPLRQEESAAPAAA
ncbi:DUF4055 domain-containing protein [Cyanobium sp. Cruz-8D1]|nr:DUF4055 domain-containing protein [Cyanobium sp. Cruz-8H5]MCP9868381.1 DUF4055 domain-containing protein [Cyanobium sp. Cruz-8D1]